jgi:hypothetical protein
MISGEVLAISNLVCNIRFDYAYYQLINLLTGSFITLGKMRPARVSAKDFKNCRNPSDPACLFAIEIRRRAPPLWESSSNIPWSKSIASSGR